MRSIAALAAISLTLLACSTNTQWRRANRQGDWLLTKLRTLKVDDRMNRDRDVRLADLERERLELELKIRACQKDGDRAAADGDQPGIDEAIARLGRLEQEYETLVAKYR